jgi:hypothetical protein
MSMFQFGEVPAARTVATISQTAVQPAAGAEPLVVLVEYDPWAMVVGSDTPRLALYDDGVVIYRTAAGHHVAKLDRDEIEALRASLKPEELNRLAGSYRVSNATDQPTTDLVLRTGSNYAHVSVYGALDSAEAESAVPSGIIAAYERLAAFERPDAVPWLPEAVEVMIWPYEYAPDESIVWPAEWPGINHPDTRQRGDSYSLYVPVSLYPDLRNFLRTRRQRGAVLIEGRKWIAQVRLPFPGEDRWMSAPEG